METGHTDLKSAKAQEVAGALSATANGHPTVYLQLTSLKALKRSIYLLLCLILHLYLGQCSCLATSCVHKRYRLPALTPVLQICSFLAYTSKSASPFQKSNLPDDLIFLNLPDCLLTGKGRNLNLKRAKEKEVKLLKTNKHLPISPTKFWNETNSISIKLTTFQTLFTTRSWKK